MRRLRIGAALELLGLTWGNLASVLGGIGIEVAFFWWLAATGRTHGFNAGAFVSAAGGWLVFVIFWLAADEFYEVLANRREPNATPPDQRGWRLPWVPLVALLLGAAIGWRWWD